MLFHTTAFLVDKRTKVLYHDIKHMSEEGGTIWIKTELKMPPIGSMSGSSGKNPSCPAGRPPRRSCRLCFGRPDPWRISPPIVVNPGNRYFSSTLSCCQITKMLLNFQNRSFDIFLPTNPGQVPSCGAIFRVARSCAGERYAIPH